MNLRPSPRIKFANWSSDGARPSYRRSENRRQSTTTKRSTLMFFLTSRFAKLPESRNMTYKNSLPPKPVKAFAKTHYAGCGFPWGESWDGQWKTNGFLKTFAKG